MKKVLALQFLLSLLFQVSQAEFPEEINEMIWDYTELNSNCRGSYPSPEQESACIKRDELYNDIKSKGYCWGAMAPYIPEYKKYWLDCREDMSWKDPIKDLVDEANKTGDSFTEYRVGLWFYDKNMHPWTIDYKQAKYWFERSAEKGDLNGQRNLANMYLLGQGVKFDIDKAESLFALSAEQGDRDSMYALAHIYSTPSYGKQDQGRLIAIFGALCDGGDQQGCDLYRKAVLKK